MDVHVNNIRKSYGDIEVLHNIELNFTSGGLYALLGPSGCGKTTLLRTIAGLETADSGKILIEGMDQNGIHPRKRKVGFVFQHYALFRHMSVFDNIAFGLRAKNKEQRPSKEEIAKQVKELILLVQLEGQQNKYPDQLSGGQKQRVALARALAVKPSLLLLDEPFGALDANVRKGLRRWLKKLHSQMHITTIMVTHDQEEALEVADKIILMNEGNVEQVGTPQEIYEKPANEFVYSFLDTVNVYHLRNEDKQVFARPHEIKINEKPQSEHDVEAVVKEISWLGARLKVEVQRKDNDQLLEVSILQKEGHDLNLSKGDTVYLHLQDWTVFMGEGI
ncbi:sulfate/molybdate ABC transporter ATP-binding protein [Spirochaeta cellobiosiphila]|uniref:sulfate/molybdate ABC transporter ATP-binding protein n=1 Tax=Spirochaeta cellobiosiphila TaxID=504483 RepID=UPI00040684EF|nr:TOBE-like domain-containing protein [Spirochaeta cellobiosiphila]